jgi:hypothetical protein
VLALFDRSESPDYRRTDAATSTFDHIAFETPLADFVDELKRLEGLGLQVETAEHAWVHWRSLYVSDPERQSSGTGLLRCQRVRVPLNMSRIHPECPDSDPYDRWVAADVLVRQEPDEEEEGDGTKDDDEGDDDKDEDGYSE